MHEKPRPFWKIILVLIAIMAFWAFDYNVAKSIKLFKPMDLPLILSGTFGELRGGHFHAGIDIKTTGREGFPVKSIDKGFVSRIKVSPYGYGKALYINHPNGLTSVYAHLEDFSPRIKVQVYELMRANKSNELNHYFEAGEIPVDAKEIIASSGNTGGSMGPHLHFELRESALQIPVNPLLYSYSIIDKEAPIVRNLYFYNLENSNGIHEPDKVNPNFTDPLTLNSNSIGLSISTFDHQDGNYNKNGVYAIEIQMDNTPVFSLRMDKISYSESRYIQAHTDPLVKNKFREAVHRCFILPGDALSIYNLAKNAGKIALSSDKATQLKVIVEDINRNKTELNYWVKADSSSNFFENQEIDFSNLHAVSQSQNFDFEGENWSIHIPNNSFYYNTHIRFEEKDTAAQNILGKKLEISSKHFDTHKKFTLVLQDKLNIEKPEKAVIVKEENGNISHLTTHYKNSSWVTKSRSFGNYYLVLDTLAPEFIKLEKDPKSGKLTFYAKDSQSGITDYHAYINGEWSVCYYDAKNDAFEIECRSCFEQSGTELVLNLSDEKRNILSIKEKF